MTDDIVTRLRYAVRTCDHGFPNGVGDSFPDPTCCVDCLRQTAAADEIERLTEWRKNALLALDKREAEIGRLRAELRTFVPWGEWLTVEGLCSHDAQEGCTRADHVRHPMFVRWETVCG